MPRTRKRKHWIEGTATSPEQPAWGPLESLLVADELCGPFMYMFAVDLEDGRRAHAYKHSSTRRYLHITDDGDLLDFVWDENPDEDRSFYEPLDDRVMVVWSVLREYVHRVDATGAEVAAFDFVLSRLSEVASASPTAGVGVRRQPG